MNLKTNLNDFKLVDFIEDIKLIEITENKIWNYHNESDLKELFELIKSRNEILKKLLEIYIESNNHLENINNEILNKYPIVESINFRNNYIEILELLNQIKNLTSKQFNRLNVSQNLFNSEYREKVLNGNKIIETQSQFTTMCKNLLKLLINKTENNKYIKPETIEELERELIINQEKDKKKITEEKSFIKKTNLEIPFEEIKKVIIENFCYQDSEQLTNEEKNEIIDKCVKSNSSQKYAKIIYKLIQKNEFEKYQFLSRKIFANTIQKMDELGIEASNYSLSQSWVMWDIIKQLYYLENPKLSNSNYLIINPLESNEKQMEIMQRHIGWIIYKEMLTGKLDNLLAKVQNSNYAKKIIDYMITTPKENSDTLPSYKLNELGKNIILAFDKT